MKISRNMAIGGVLVLDYVAVI